MSQNSFSHNPAFQVSQSTPCIESLRSVLHEQPPLHDPQPDQLVQDALENKEAISLECGALATWTPAHSTGRSPKDTYVVKHADEENIDWSSPTNIPLDPTLFDSLWNDALHHLESKDRIYSAHRTIGADPHYALPTHIVTDKALSLLFTYNMFRPVPENLHESVFAGKPFTLLTLPKDIVDQKKYAGKLNTENDKASPLVICMDMKRKLGLVLGSWYQGSQKKLLFTVMNYYLPEHGILPLHCSANEGKQGDVALFLGLSGTGKTTLSTDASRALLGDDEHGWSDNGIANFENGCYAKLIRLDPEKEPDIYDATFHEAPVTEHFSIIENAMVYPDGSIDLNDDRITENSRVSYPLTSLRNTKTSSCGGHPKSIIFLTADANGVLPPVAKLNRGGAMLWFLMGYTSKLAGTETGITEPKSAFSRFFGGPFMPRLPNHYTHLFGEKIDQHKVPVYLVNTGWVGGAYGTGKRIDITATRAIINAIIAGELEDGDYRDDTLFHLQVPTSCPGVPAELLDPSQLWSDPSAYVTQAKKLAQQFSDQFDATYSKANLDPLIVAACPGK